MNLAFSTRLQLAVTLNPNVWKRDYNSKKKQCKFEVIIICIL